MSENSAITSTELLRMTTDVVSSYVAKNQLTAEQLPDLISAVHASLKAIGEAPPPTQEPEQKPAVSVRRSITPDYLICLEDGKKLKMLKRYLNTNYGMTPDQYRQKWGLPADYPMVAPNYAKQRSEFAKEIGLGRASRRGRRRAK